MFFKFPSGINSLLFERLPLAILLDQVWCNKCSCFSYYDSVFISPSFLKDIFFWIYYSGLTVLFLKSTLKTVCHFHLHIMISNEKSAVI